MPAKKMINGFPFIKYVHNEISYEEALTQSSQFLSEMKQRRSVRHFSTKPVSGD